MKNKVLFTLPEIKLISWIFKAYKPKAKNDLINKEFSQYLSIQEKLKDITNNKIKWEEFKLLLKMLNKFKIDLECVLPKKEFKFLLSIIDKFKSLDLENGA